MINEVRMANQANFENSSSGVLVATKAQAFGVNYSNISKVIIYELPDSMEVLYQMIGRASREGKSGEIVIFHNRRILSRHFANLQQSLLLGKITKGMADGWLMECGVGDCSHEHKMK